MPDPELRFSLNRFSLDAVEFGLGFSLDAARGLEMPDPELNRLSLNRFSLDAVELGFRV